MVDSALPNIKTVGELRRELKQLLEKKKNLNNELKSIYNQERRLMQSGDDLNPNLVHKKDKFKKILTGNKRNRPKDSNAEAEQDEEIEQRKEKIKSVIVANLPAESPRKLQSIIQKPNSEEHSKDAKDSSKPTLSSVVITTRPKEVQKDDMEVDDLQRRNKNLIRGIFSHLGKAKQILDKDSQKIKQQESVTQKITQHIKLETSDIREKHKEQLETKKTDSTNKRKLIEQQILEKEKEIFTMQISEYYDLLSNYILTKSGPPVYWLPVQDTESTKKLLEESKLNSQQKKENYKKNFDQKESEFDSSAVLATEQK